MAVLDHGGFAEQAVAYGLIDAVLSKRGATGKAEGA